MQMNAACALMFLLAMPALRADQESPLPSGQQLAERMLARAKQVESARLWTQYQYRRTSTRRELDENGGTEKQEELRYLMIPKGDLMFPQLVAKNGHPPSAADLAKENEWFE